jgi:UDP-2-acetamido-2-deoxy-ribo-hexuluronate aminotransferase
VVESENRDELMNKLKKNEIGCAIHYPTPLPHLKSYSYQDHKLGDFPVAEKLCSEILSLPMYAEMGEAEVEGVCEITNLSTNYFSFVHH